MKTTLKTELPALALVLLPFLYLAFLWGKLPEKVPMHWNLEGEIDRYGSKWELLLIPILLPLLTYGLLLMIPKIDPKGKIKNMGAKYNTLKLLMTGFMSVLALVILYSTQKSESVASNLIFLLIGGLFALLGNYFKTLKPNYFIGIRTPWTLENETVWRDTHVLGGKIWFVGGLAMVLSSLLLERQANFIVFLTITAILVLVPIAYSYVRFKKIKQNA